MTGRNRLPGWSVISIVSILFSLNCRSGGWIDPAPLDTVELQKIEPAEKEKPAPRATPPEKIKSWDEASTGDAISLEPASESFQADAKNPLQPDSTAPPPEEIEKEKKLYPIHFSARQIIREKKYLPLIKEEGVMVTLKGSARVNHASTQLYAQNIFVIGDNGEIALISDPLKIIDKENDTVLTAGYGEYRRYGQTAFIEKGPVVEYGSGKGKLRMEADIMNHYFKTGITNAEGNVKVYKDEMTGYGKSATYERATQTVSLLGNPRIFDQENVYSADQMIFFRNEEKVLFKKNVKVLITQQEDNDSKNGSKIVTIIESNTAEYATGSRIYLKKRVTFRGAPNRPVRVIREDSDITCDRLTGWGEGLQELQMSGSIEIVYKRDKTRLYGEVARYWKTPGAVKMESVKKNDEKLRPYALFYDEEGRNTGRLSAESLERNVAVKKTFARGDVDMQLFSGETVDGEPQVTRLHGQLAEMSDEEGVVTLLGRPYIDQGSERIYAQKILVYPEENKVELIGSLTGVFSNN